MKYFWINFYDVNGDPLFNSFYSKTLSTIDEKFKFVIKQSKKAGQYFIEIEKYNTKQELVFSKSYQVTPVEATDVTIKITKSNDYILSNLKARSDPKCIFEDQSVQDFWFGGFLINGALYTQSGVKLDQIGGVDVQTGVINQKVSKKKVCFKMTKATTQLAAQLHYFKIDANSVVDCDKGNSTFLCWKKPNVCSVGKYISIHLLCFC